MSTVSVIVATYGDRAIWNPLADRALESVTRQTRKPDAVVRVHGTALHAARNAAAEAADSEFLVILDADDELDPGYLEAMMAGNGDLRHPKIRRVAEDGEVLDKNPYEIRMASIHNGNFMVIGTMMRRSDFMKVGGFRDLQAYEDWDFFWRVLNTGAKPELCPGAVYIVHQRQESRNRISVDDSQRLSQWIRKENSGTVSSR